MIHIIRIKKKYIKFFLFSVVIVPLIIIPINLKNLDSKKNLNCPTALEIKFYNHYGSNIYFNYMKSRFSINFQN